MVVLGKVQMRMFLRRFRCKSAGEGSNVNVSSKVRMLMFLGMRQR